MDNLKKPMLEFYGHDEGLARALKKTDQPAGRELIAKAYQRQHIQDALKHSYRRRTYSNSYFKRDGRKAYLADFEDLGPRWVKDCQDVHSRIGHNGWYMDEDGLGTLIGVVLCFARHGAPDLDGNGYEPVEKAIYMAGTRHSDWDGVTLDLDTTDDPITAAQWADSMAEREAEDCREEDEKYRTGQKMEELREEIATARTACLKLLRAWRPFRKGNPDQLVLFGAVVPKLSDTLCSELRQRVQDYCESIAGYRNELKELT